MPKTHTVAQGETLTRIARQHGLSSWKTIYYDAANDDYRKKRPDPDLIYPGDVIAIPDIEPRKFSASTGMKYVFCLKEEKEMFRIKLEDENGEGLRGKRVVLDVRGQSIDGEVGDDGLLEIELEDGSESAGSLKVYDSPDDEEPSHEFELELGCLDPVEELSGVQARCNALGFPCGVVDGVMGANTRKGVRAFQLANGLQVDGVPGPKTKAKLKQVYGC